MDPNETLSTLRECVKDADNPGTFTVEILSDMAEAFDNLDEWLSQGGFPPEAWRHAR